MKYFPTIQFISVNDKLIYHLLKQVFIFCANPRSFLIASLLDSIEEIEKSEEELPNTFSY